MTHQITTVKLAGFLLVSAAAGAAASQPINWNTAIMEIPNYLTSIAAVATLLVSLRVSRKVDGQQQTLNDVNQHLAGRVGAAEAKVGMLETAAAKKD